MDDVMTDPGENPPPSWRKPAGAGLILLIIAGWAWLVTTAIAWAGDLPVWIEIPIYAVAGVAWIAPLGPVLQWMETGRWRPGPAQHD